MYRIKEAIIVEGVYDKIKLSGFIDGVILTTHGFAIYTNKDFIATVKMLAEETGIVILTDSDSAGMRIRNFIKQHTLSGTVLHAYVPDIKGRERRKQTASAEGLLGVEGMKEQVIIKALRDAGCTIDDRSEPDRDGGITKADMYMLGLSGGTGARALREKLSHELGIPAKLSSNMLLDVLNRLVTVSELREIINKIR